MNPQSRTDRNIRLYYLTEIFSNLLFLIPIYIAFQQNYLTLIQMGLLASARYVMQALMELPTGVFADLWGRKTSCAIGSFIDAAGLLLIAAFPSAQGVIIGTLIRAVGESAISGASTALIYDTLKENGREDEFGKVSAREGMFTQATLVVATFLGGFLYALSPVLPFFLSGTNILIAAFFYLSMYEPKLDSIKYSWRSYVENTKSGIRQLYKNRYITYLSAYYMLIAGITWSWMMYILLVYVNNIGLTESRQGIVLSVSRIINAVIINILTVKILRFTRARGAWIHPAVMAAGSIMALAPSPVINILAVMPIMFSSTLRFNLLYKLVNEVFDSRHRATSLSALNFLMGFVYIGIVAASGYVFEQVHPRWMFALTGLLPLPLILWLAYKMKVSYTFHKITEK